MFKRVLGLLLVIALGKGSLAQGVTNKGKEFWVSYPYHWYYENGGDCTGSGCKNSQEMVLYFSAEQNANVTVTSQTITTNASGVPVVNKWIRNYTVPAGTVKISDYIPKAGVYDARLFGLPVSFGGNGCEGIFDKGIRVESDVPIVVYAHYIGAATSGAAMIMPVEALGYEYITINNDQSYSNAYTYFYVMAAYDNTKVQITPSVTTRHGKPAGVPFEVTLNKFQSYQVIASSLSGDLTGSKVKSLANSSGECLPMAVFAGTSRTGLSCSGPGGGSGDFAMQQCFPTHAWGKRFLTAPTSNASGPSSKMTNIYRVLVKDPTTKVYLNGTQITAGYNAAKGYYHFNSGNADYIEADKPVMVAQYMSSTGACPNTSGDGDPEMMYISPLEQAINRVGFYRNDEESINHNYLTLVIPNGGTGISSLTIDGVPFSATLPGVKASYVHPRNPAYSVIVRYWTASKNQVIVQSDSAFNAITYGLGSVESYGYNGGTYLKNLNAESSIHNVPDTTAAASHGFNCKGTPVKLSMLMRYIPTKLVWKISSLGTKVTPNADVTMLTPQWVDTPYVMGVKYYKYTLPDTYIFNDTGVFTIPVYSTSPTIDNCNNTEMVNFYITVKPSPTAGFTFTHTGCIKDTVLFSSPATTSNGYNISRWTWAFAAGDSAFIKDPKKLFADTGTYNVKMNVITSEGCTADSVRPVSIKPVPTAAFGITPAVLCQGGTATFSDSAYFGGTTPINNWYWNFGNGNVVNATTAANQTMTYPAPGSYTIKHMVKVSDLCVSDTVSKVLVVNTKAKVDSLVHPTACLPASGIANFSVGFNDAGGSEIVSYSWNFGDPASGANNTSTLRNPSHTFSAQGVNYPVTLTIMTATGCSGDTLFYINSNVTPVVTTNSPAPVCAGQTVSLTASGANTYSWTGPNLAANTGSAVTATPTTSAVYQVIGTSNGCTDTVDISVTVNPVPAKPVVVTPVNYCQGASAAPLSATAAAGNTLTWYDNAGLTGGSATAPPVNTTVAGTTKYYVTQTSAAGCRSEADTITVTVFPSIANNTVSTDQTICAGSAASNLTGANATGGNGTYVYQWQESTDGGATWNNISGANAPDYNPGSPASTRMYRRNVESGLCTSTSNVVTVSVQPGMTNINIAANQTICEGATPALIDGQTPTGGSGTYTYTWEVSADNISWTTVSGATTEDYQPAALTATTYFRRKVNGGNCVATSNTVTITVNPFAAGTISAPATICEYNTADIIFTSTSGTAPFSISYSITNPAGSSTTASQSGVTSGQTFNVIPAGSPAGNYTVTLTSLGNSNGCVRTTGLNYVTITVTPTPVITIAPVSPVCQGKSATLTASGATTYAWTGPNLSSSTGSSVTATPPSTQTYTVTGTTNGCNGTATVDVVVNPNPATSPVPTTPVAYCQFATAAPLAATASAGHTLMWYDNAGLTGGSATAIVPSTANAGSFNYYVTQKNSFNCESAPATITVQITAGLGGNTIGSEQTLCQGNAPAALTGTGTLTGGNGTFAYQWQQSIDGVNWTNISGATSASYSPGSLNDTTWFRRNVSSNQCGSSSNAVVINVYEGFSNYNISTASFSICDGNTPAQLNGQTPGGAGPFNFTWQQSYDGSSWTDIPSANTEDYQPPALTATTHYRRKVTNGPCTAISNVVIVNVNPLPNGNITAPAAICEYQAASFTFNATAGTGPFNIVYTVTDPAGTSNTVTISVNNGAAINVIPTGSAPGYYTVNLVSMQSNEGCTRNGLNNVTIVVNATPVVTIAPPAEVCIGAAGSLTASGAGSYAWTGPGLSSYSGATVSATPPSVGSHTYSVVGTANGCVSAPVSADLLVNPKPVASFTIADPVICLDETAYFTNTSTISAGTIDALYWDFDNGEMDTTSYTTSSLAQAYSTHRIYNVKLKAVSAKGCISDQFIDDISVNPIPVAAFKTPAYVCMPGGTAQFVNTSTIANGAPMTYSWTFGDPASGSFNNATTKDGVHVYPDSASYDVTLVATSVQGCSHQVTLPFNTFFNKPVASFSVSPDTLCQGIQNAFFDSSFAPGSTIEKRVWSFGDGTMDSSANPTKTYSSPGKYEVLLHVYNMQGCSADTSHQVMVYLQPVIDAGQSYIVPQGTTITFNGNTNSGALSLTWTSPTGGVVSNPNILRPTYVADQDGVFVLTATGDGNCTASDTISVKILRPITIPNAFSPNGDGVNDTWGIPNLADYPNAVVEVFNRYGQPVYRSFGYTKAWDGTLNGKELPVGTYYYIIDPKSGFARITGYVVILK